MLLCKIIMHLMEISLHSPDLFPLFLCCTVECNLWFMRTKAHFQSLFRTKTCFLIYGSSVRHFYFCFYSIALMNVTRKWFGSQIIRCSSCLDHFFTYTIHMLVVFERNTIHVIVYCRLLKGKLSKLTCQLAHLTASMSLSILWEAHQSNMSHSWACVWLAATVLMWSPAPPLCCEFSL